MIFILGVFQSEETRDSRIRHQLSEENIFWMSFITHALLEILTHALPQTLAHALTHALSPPKQKNP